MIGAAVRWCILGFVEATDFPQQWVVRTVTTIVSSKGECVMFASSVFDALNVICLINDDAFNEESAWFNPAHEYALLCDTDEEKRLLLDASPSALQEFDDFWDRSFTVCLGEPVEPTTDNLAAIAKALRATAAASDGAIHSYVEDLIADGCERSVALVAEQEVRNALLFVAGCISSLLAQGDKEDA